MLKILRIAVSSLLLGMTSCGIGLGMRESGTIATPSTSSSSENQLLVITSPTSSTTITNLTQTNVSVSGTCESGINVVFSGAVSGSTSCLEGAFTIVFNLSSASDGPVVLTASQTDLAGHTSTSSVTCTKNSSLSLILSSIRLSANSYSVFLGKTKQFTLTGTFSDGSPADLTEAAVWSSSDVTKATVSNTSGSKGLVSALSAGTTTIEATVDSYLSSTSLTVTGCPTGFVKISKNTAVGVADDFCVAKYEMKNVGGIATSQSASAPWTFIDVPTSISKCQALGTGYDLMTNAEWQAMARDIETATGGLFAGYYLNWSNGSTAGNNYISQGMNSGATALSASTDNDPCSGTGHANCAVQTHPDYLYNRVNTLSSGDVIWDAAGNVGEWVKDSSALFSVGSDFYLVQEEAWSVPNARALFGPMGSYSKTSTPFGGLGKAWLSYLGNAIIRGGDFTDGDGAGIYAISNALNSNATNGAVGFRCAIHP